VIVRSSIATLALVLAPMAQAATPQAQPLSGASTAKYAQHAKRNGERRPNPPPTHNEMRARLLPDGTLRTECRDMPGSIEHAAAHAAAEALRTEPR